MLGFMSLVFICLQGGSNRRRLGFLLLCSCHVSRALMNSFCFYMNVLGFRRGVGGGGGGGEDKLVPSA